MFCKKKIIKILKVNNNGEDQRLYPMKKKFKKSEL